MRPRERVTAGYEESVRAVIPGLDLSTGKGKDDLHQTKMARKTPQQHQASALGMIRGYEEEEDEELPDREARHSHLGRQVAQAYHEDMLSAGPSSTDILDKGSEYMNLLK